MPEQTQYDCQNAAFKVDGYFIPKPASHDLKSMEAEFINAREQCVMNLKKDLEIVEALTFDQFRIYSESIKYYLRKDA